MHVSMRLPERREVGQGENQEIGGRSKRVGQTNGKKHFEGDFYASKQKRVGRKVYRTTQVLPSGPKSCRQLLGRVVERENCGSEGEGGGTLGLEEVSLFLCRD